MKAWPACLLALLLTACAGLPPPSPAALTLGPPLQRFIAEGRISLRQGGHSDHLRFRWEHTRESDAVLLMSPLGQGMAELTRDAGGARLTQPNQAPVLAASLALLAQRVTGAPLPLEALADWLRGARPALSGEVDGWQVVISDTTVLRRSRLLRVMEASREDVGLKLIVDEWDAPE